MKRLFTIFATVLAGAFAIGLASCGKGDDKDTAIIATPDEASFTAAGGTKDIVITSELDWDAIPSDQWILVAETGGGISITVNATTEAREGSVTVDNGSRKSNIKVTQAAPGKMVVSSTLLDFEAEGDTKFVTVTSETEWTTTPNADWIEVALREDGFTVTVDAASQTREGAIEVDNGIEKITVVVSQVVPVEMTIEPESLDFAVEGGHRSVNVDSESAWEVESDQPWLTVTKNGTDSFTAMVSTNDGRSRKATITVTNSAGYKSVPVIQAADGVEYFTALGGFHGTYYGYDTGNFMIDMFSAEDPRQALQNGYYIVLDLVSPMPSLNGDYFDILSGTYDVTPHFGPYTIVIDPVGTTAMLRYVNGAYSGIYITGGTFTIEGDHNLYDITFDFTIREDPVFGTRFKGYYSGPITNGFLNDDSWEPPVPKESLDAGTVTGATFDMLYGGDYFGYGVDTWIVSAYSSTVQRDGDNYTGDGYVLTSQFGASMGDGQYMPDAMYGILREVLRAPSALQGFKSNDGKLQGTWLQHVVGGVVTHSLPARAGTITTTRSGDTYTFVIDAVDDTGAYIDGTFTGEANVGPYMSVSLSGLSESNVNAAERRHVLDGYLK